MNGKAYIGRSVDVHKRWSQHRAAAGKRPYPIYAAMRKYGIESFIFEVIEVCDPLQLRARELAAIERYGTWAGSRGYNIGGTNSGFPSNEEIALMPPDEAETWRARIKANGLKGHQALREYRLQPEYDAQYRAMRSAGSSRREAAMRVKRAEDPQYDALIRSKRSAATTHRAEGYQKQVGEEFKKRFASDAEFAATISRNRRRANAASHAVRREKQRPFVEMAVRMRREGALLREIAEAVGKSVPWACVATKGVAHAALS